MASMRDLTQARQNSFANFSPQPPFLLLAARSLSASMAHAPAEKYCGCRARSAKNNGTGCAWRSRTGAGADAYPRICACGRESAGPGGALHRRGGTWNCHGFPGADRPHGPGAFPWQYGLGARDRWPYLARGLATLFPWSLGKAREQWGDLGSVKLGRDAA